MTKEQVIDAPRQMSPDDRASIVAAIDPAEDGPATAADLRAELARRWAAYEADPTNVITFEQFKAKLAAGR